METADNFVKRNIDLLIADLYELFSVHRKYN